MPWIDRFSSQLAKKAVGCILTHTFFFSFIVCTIVPSNPLAGAIAKVEISFFLLLLCSDKLLSTPKAITLLLNLLLFHNEKGEGVSDSITYPEQKYLSESAFLFNLTAPNKEFAKLKLLPRSNYQKVNS